MIDATDHFRDAILATLGAAPDIIEADRLIRFSTNGKRSDLSGWCTLFGDERAGVFGCFRQGVRETWCAEPESKLTRAERAAIKRKIAEAKAQREAEQLREWRRNRDRIAYWWRQCRPVTPGDPVELYLRRRLAVDSLNVPDCLRLHSAMPYRHNEETIGTWPAMVAPVMAPDGTVVALHRTFLEPDGRKADVPGPVKKLTPAAGWLKGAAIRLALPVDGLLAVAEGIETALAAAAGSGVSTWSAYCANGIASWRWPANVRKVIVFSDSDEAGNAAAENLRVRATGAGLSCLVLAPTALGVDWADVWLARGANA